MSNDEFTMGNTFEMRASAAIHSSFVIRHWSFRRAWLLAIPLCLPAALGCRGSAVDVAKGRPSDTESNAIVSDYDEHKEPTGWERLAPENWGKEAKKAVGLGPNKPIAEQAFEEGIKQYKAKNFNAARKQFAKAADRWPDSALEEDATFMEGESYFFADRYSSAVDTYGNLVKKYPNTRYLDIVISHQFMVARYWQQMDHAHHRWTLVANLFDRTQPLFDTGGHWINSLAGVRVNDPRGPLADSAIMAVANEYYLKHRFEDADYYYGLLRTDYPKSKYQLQAHLLGIQCKLLKYQGPAYNGKPLEEADQLIDQTLLTFNREMHDDRDERDRLVRAKAEIKAQRATRDVMLAQYWDHGEHYGAAKIYYAKVMKDYPDTPFSNDAKTRLAALDGKPDNPPNRLAFLTDWWDPAAKREAADKDTVRR